MAEPNGLTYPAAPPPTAAPWRYPARTKPEAPVTLNPADPVVNWAQWRLAQVPDLNRLGQEAMAWDWRTQPEPQGPESAKLRASMEGGGPIGLGAPGAFAGMLRDPLKHTMAKYLHPQTGEEPVRVFHGTKKAFEHFDPKKADPEALFGPGHYFTENPKVASGYTETGPDHGYLLFDAGRYGRKDAEVYAEHIQSDVIPVRIGGTVTGWKVPTPTAPNVRPAHLDIRKPFDIDAPIPLADLTRISKVVRQLGGRELLPAEHGEALYRELVDAVGTKEMANRILQQAGYDGITHMGGSISGGEPHRVWIAFDPKQVVNPFEYRKDATK